MTAMIRLATPHDAIGVQAIYAPVVRETTISCELEPPTVEDMRQRIGSTLERMPSISTLDTHHRIMAMRQKALSCPA
jgi:L-amino acid N-acyltransferase YncA